MSKIRISTSRFSFVRRILGKDHAAQLKAQRQALKESPTDPEIIWVRLLTGKEHRMFAVLEPE